MFSGSHQPHGKSHASPDVSVELTGKEQVGASSVRVLLVGIIKIEHCAPELTVILLGHLAYIITDTHFVEQFMCLSHDTVQSTGISLGKDTAQPFCPYKVGKFAHVIECDNRIKMRSEHFRVILDDSVGFTLPDSISPSLIIRKFIVAVLSDNNIPEFAVNYVRGSFSGLYCVCH